jgi:2-octaprenyl-6-methoxyphenol hydroxylase
MGDKFGSTQQFDVAIIGGGPVGLATATGLMQAGVSTVLLARRQPYADNRTTALLGHSIDLLERLQVWNRCRANAAALRVMRLVDDTGRLIRAPEVRFSSTEIGHEAFGYNIENQILMAALEERISEQPDLKWLDDEADAVTPGEDAVNIRTRGGDEFSARVVVGADGRNSIARTAAGITVKRRQLDQTAITFNVSHTRPHNNVSTEFHTVNGPCVFVPLPGDRSSVVWVTSPRDAQHLADAGDDDLAQVAERRSHSILGRLHIEGQRNTFPLTIEQPTRLAARRVALIGESAHVLPPIGAQGLNMGLRDVADITEIVTAAIHGGEDPGAARVLLRYERARLADINSRVIAIDLANRSLLSEMLPLQIVRALGFHMVGASGPLRRIAMREGLAPSWRSTQRSTG